MSEDPTLREGTRAHYRDAAQYDRTYARRREDIDFYARLAEERGGCVLELGVGSGRVAVAMAERGVEVVGVDLMPSMLERAQLRLDKAPPAVRDRVTLLRGDLRKLRLDRRFSLVVAPFNVFMHLYTRKDIERALSTVKAHLRPRGRLAFDVLMPSPHDLARDPNHVYKLGSYTRAKDGRRYRYRENFRYDAARQVQLVTMAWVADGHDGAPESSLLAHRQFFPAELEALLHYNGLRVERHEGGFEGETLDDESESQVVVAKARARGRGKPTRDAR
ncbi:MAG: class I SAM-dependent methyltransferase [Deltaproteobacteria bacterium]|nr:class I SAM-dependent methyltransferase [Deltaproteobacteria bacterium]